MKKTSILALLLLFTVLLRAQTIDGNKSKVNFTISNMEVKTVEGSFTGMTGEVAFNSENLKSSSFKVCIDAATINTGIEKRDNHLRSADFFEVSKYPQICFTSKSISKTKDGYEVTGILTIHGVSKKVVIPFTFNNNTFTGKINVNRRDYKIGESTNNFMVGEMAEVEIICVIK